MTFDKIKRKLDRMNTETHDKYQVLIANLYSKIVVNDKKTAEALEAASMALMLYTNGGK